MPATGYQHDCAPEIEVYPKGDMYSPDYKCEIWIPVKKYFFEESIYVWEKNYRK